MSSIVTAKPVYVLHQRIRSGPPQPGQHDAFTYFIAESPTELEELAKLFRAGKVDSRIVEQPPANEVFDGDFQTETVSFTAPDGNEMPVEVLFY
jgi:hypothetical protein